jgi:ABC-type antimicrobial peptide transport system permease subunit
MAIGVAALVATVGIAQSAGNQILSRLLAVDRTLIRVTPSQLADSTAINWRSEQAVLRLDGVRAVGTFGTVTKGAVVTTRPTPSARRIQLDVIAATHGLDDALETTIIEGRFLDPGNGEASRRTAVLGSGAATLLDFGTLTPGRDAIFIEGIPFSVVGIMDTSSDEPSLSNAVFIPPEAGLDAPAIPETVLVRTQPNASEVIASQVAQVINPNQPNQLSISLPLSEAQLARDIESDVNALFLTLGLVAVAVAGIGIANMTLVSVVERRQEIGLRRALGATPLRVGAEFLTESAVLGFLGGVVGAAVGVIVISLSAAIQDWLPIVDPRVLLVGIAIGVVVGVLSGIYPALRAAALEPTRAIRAV